MDDNVSRSLTQRRERGTYAPSFGGTAEPQLFGKVRVVDERSFEVAAGVRSGDLLAGKYRVDRVLGVGGMGVVVAAYHVQLEMKVALKFLLPAMTTNEEAVGRFIRESRAAAKIASEHVARVLDVGQLESGAPYMVMEFLEGCDLAQWIATRGPLSVEQTVEFVLQACEAIADAHSLGIVHRDLKPANLFRVDRADGIPRIKVLDFGISKVMSPGLSAPQMAMTRTAMAMGSPLYMSPEQMESAREVDRRTDIWALGIILHELLTGKVPFEGTTLPEICIKIATKPPPLLRSTLSDAPAAIEAAIQRCLQKDRDNRYPSVAELAVALMPYGPARSRISIERIARLDPEGTLFEPVGVHWPHAGPSARPSEASGTLGTMGRTMHEPSRRRGALWAVLGGAGVAVALAVGFAVRHVPPPPATVGIAPPPAAPMPPAVTALAPVPPTVSEPPAAAVEPVPVVPVATLPKAPPGPPHPSARAASSSSPVPARTPTRPPGASAGAASAGPSAAAPQPTDADPFSRLKPL